MFDFEIMHYDPVEMKKYMMSRVLLMIGLVTKTTQLEQDTFHHQGKTVFWLYSCLKLYLNFI